MRIALLPTTGTSFPLCRCFSQHTDSRSCQFPAIWRAWRPVPTVWYPSSCLRLPEVAGERRVESQLSHKIAESLPVRDRLDPELRRHQTLHGAAELASHRSRCTGKISLSDFPGAAVSSKTSLVQDHFFQNNGHVV